MVHFAQLGLNGIPGCRRHSTALPTRALACSLLLAVVAGLAAGCGRGGPDYPCITLRGNVTVGGQPLESGAMQFLPLDGGQGPTVGTTVVQGRYVAENVPLGKVRVLFTSVKRGKQLGSVEDIPVFETIHLIPEPYRGGVVIEVSQSQTVHDFEM